MRGLFVWGMLTLLSCNAALDFDALQAGTKETEDTENETLCIDASDCDDGIECTLDKCNKKGRCSNEPNNDVCSGFEVCRRNEGCVDIGRECILDSDCDDGVVCTKDYCDNDGACRNTVDDDLCVDPENLCLTNRTCDAEAGCVGGFEKQCDQEEDTSCYNIFCNPETGACDLRVPKPGADDDEDGYCDMNSSFDGDDCLDDDNTIYPGADEKCDRLDNDCDGLNDGAVVAAGELVESEHLAAPSVAFGEGRFLVVWQDGTEGDTRVKLQLLGEGACLVDPLCTTDEWDKASEIIDFTEMAGDGTAGYWPTTLFVDGQFHLVWVAPDGGGLHVFRSVVTIEGDVPTVNEADMWAEQSYSSVSSLDLAAVDDHLVAAWAGIKSDNSVKLMVSVEGKSLMVDGLEGGSGAVSIDCNTVSQCLMSYEQDKQGDHEIYVGVLLMDEGGAFDSGWPKLISLVDKEDKDPSSLPDVAWLDGESWAVAFSDVASGEEESDIRGSIGHDVLDLVTDGIGEQRMGSLVYGDGNISLSFINDVQGDLSLQVGLFDTQFTRVADQRTEIAISNGGAIESSKLIWTGAELAVAFVNTDADGDARLEFLAFEMCQSSE